MTLRSPKPISNLPKPPQRTHNLANLYDQRKKTSLRVLPWMGSQAVNEVLKAITLNLHATTPQGPCKGAYSNTLSIC